MKQFDLPRGFGVYFVHKYSTPLIPSSDISSVNRSLGLSLGSVARSLRATCLTLKSRVCVNTMGSEDQLRIFERVTYRSAGSSVLKFLRSAVSGHYSACEPAYGLMSGRFCVYALNVPKADEKHSLFFAAAGLPLSLLYLQLSYMKSLERQPATFLSGHRLAALLSKNTSFINLQAHKVKALACPMPVGVLGSALSTALSSWKRNTVLPAFQEANLATNIKQLRYTAEVA